MCTFTNSEDLDEMLHNAAFHQGLHCLICSSVKKIHFFFIILTCLDYNVQCTIQSLYYFINPEALNCMLGNFASVNFI